MRRSARHGRPLRAGLIALVILCAAAAVFLRGSRAASARWEILPPDGFGADAVWQIRRGTQLYEIRSDSAELYCLSGGVRQPIHPIQDAEMMTFFVTQVAGLELPAVVVADPDGNGFGSIRVYRYDASAEAWRILHILQGGALLPEAVFYGHARTNPGGVLEFAQRIPKDMGWEFVLYQACYDREQERLVVEESERFDGGFPLWWPDGEPEGG